MSNMINRKEKKNRCFLLLYACLFLSFFVLQLFPQVSEEHIAPGVIFQERYLSEGPWAVQIVTIQREKPGIYLEAVLGTPYILGIEPLTRIIDRHTYPGHYPIAGINGDFYILRIDPFQGDPSGLCIINYEIVSSPNNRSVFAILDDGTPVIDRFTLAGTIHNKNGEPYKVNGINQRCPSDGLVILTSRFSRSTQPTKGFFQILAGPLDKPLIPGSEYTLNVLSVLDKDSTLSLSDTTIALVGIGTGAGFLRKFAVGDQITCKLPFTSFAGNIKHAIGGTPRLIRNGIISIEGEEEGVSPAFTETRHPRTAIGFNASHIFLVVVDGRQPGYSVGMSLSELAYLMKELGAVEALNLDGGGSTTMWVQGKIRNRPSDGFIRPVANGLIVVSENKPK